MSGAILRSFSNAPPVFPENARSLLKKYLTQDLWDQLKDRRTSGGVTLHDCIRSGVALTDSEVGLYACDAESYQMFAALFAPVIAECHPGFQAGRPQPHDLTAAHFQPANPDPEARYIVSTRIRLARNLHGYNLRPAATGDADLEVEQLAKGAFAKFSGDLAGGYCPMIELDATAPENHIFRQGDRFQEAAGLNRNWPNGRGVFANAGRTFFVWVNEEDHLRLISIQQGADIAAVFARLCAAVAALAPSLPFARSDSYGYISSCPTNLGTGLRASFHIRLPLSGESPAFQEICARRHLAVRGSSGEYSPTAGAIYDISNKRRLGVSEVACLEECLEGTRELMDLERSFEAAR